MRRLCGQPSSCLASFRMPMRKPKAPIRAAIGSEQAGQVLHRDVLESTRPRCPSLRSELDGEAGAAEQHGTDASRLRSRLAPTPWSQEQRVDPHAIWERERSIAGGGGELRRRPRWGRRRCGSRPWSPGSTLRVPSSRPTRPRPRGRRTLNGWMDIETGRRQACHRRYVTRNQACDHSCRSEWAWRCVTRRDCRDEHSDRPAAGASRSRIWASPSATTGR